MALLLRQFYSMEGKLKSCHYLDKELSLAVRNTQ